MEGRGTGWNIVSAGPSCYTSCTKLFGFNPTYVVIKERIIEKQVAKEIIIQKPQQKENQMIGLGDMSVGAIIGIFLIGVIAAKLAHRFVWRTLFRPLKKQARTIAKEWKEADKEK